MNKLLLIQPSGSRPRLLQRLQAADVPYFEQSFIDIQAVRPALTHLTTTDAVIWISKNAVKFALEAGLKLPRQVAMYAVGPATAQYACQQFKRPCQCPTFEHSSEGLLKLPQLTDVEAQQWCLIKGKGGRELLADSLVARGASVRSLEVYQRVKKPLSDAGVVQDWMQQVNRIMVSSAEQLAYFLSELPPHADAWLRTCHWIVPSERLSQLIPFVQDDAVTVTQSASENAMINALLEDGN